MSPVNIANKSSISESLCNASFHTVYTSLAASFACSIQFKTLSLLVVVSSWYISELSSHSAHPQPAGMVKTSISTPLPHTLYQSASANDEFLSQSIHWPLLFTSGIW